MTAIFDEDPEQHYRKVLQLLDPKYYGAQTQSMRNNVMIERVMVGDRIRVVKKYPTYSEAMLQAGYDQQTHEMTMVANWIRDCGKSGFTGRNTQMDAVVQLDVYGLDLDDWETLCRNASLDPFSSPHAILAMISSILRSLYVFHQKGFVHCDIKLDNFCVPRSLDDAHTAITNHERIGRMHLAKLTEIDLGCSYYKSAVPKFYGGIFSAAPYVSAHYKTVMQEVEQLRNQRDGCNDPHQAQGFANRIEQQLQRLSWRIDFFSLSCLLKDLWSVASDLHGAQQLKNDHRHGLLASGQTPQPNYSPTYQPIYQPAKLAELGRAVDLIEQLCTDFAAHDNVLGSSHTNTPLSTELPHQNYIHTIDQVLSSSGLAVDWARGMPYKLFDTYRVGHLGGPKPEQALRPQRGPTDMVQPKPKTESTPVVQAAERTVLKRRRFIRSPELPFDTYEPGKTFIDHKESPQMVFIPAGRFVMGSPASEHTPLRAANLLNPGYSSTVPQHTVAFSLPFLIAQSLVTHGQFKRFVEATGYRTEAEKDKDFCNWQSTTFHQTDLHPVVYVSYRDAQEYVAWLNVAVDFKFIYRLPSEAEWEYAARGGTTTAFYTGDQITPEQANFDGNRSYNGSPYGPYKHGTTPVGSYAVNAPHPWNLHDVHGNAWEWMNDWWHEDYDGAPVDGSSWLDGGRSDFVVLRGGGWDNNPAELRSAHRIQSHRLTRNSLFSFRIARSLR